MSRTRNTLFYEQTLPDDLPEKHQWLIVYHENSRRLKEYLDEKGAAKRTSACAIRCLSALRTHLLESEIPYSKEAADSWLCDQDQKYTWYNLTLERFADINTYGEVKSYNSFPREQPYVKPIILDEPWNSLSSGYLETLFVSDDVFKRKKGIVENFFYYFQNMKIDHPLSLTYLHLDSFMNSRKLTIISDLTEILKYMASKGLCSQGLCWYPYLKHRGILLQISELTSIQKQAINQIREESQDFSINEYASVIPDFLNRFRSKGYNNDYCKTAKRILLQFLVFLEMHNYGYHKVIVDIWLENQKENYSHEKWAEFRRILYIFDLYVHEGDVLVNISFRNFFPQSELLPDWCKDELYAYLQVKKREGYKKNTLISIRSAVTKFCLYLVKLDLKSFSDISPQILKDFNISDVHRCITGKNAYNGIIRKFIRHLERKEIVHYGLNQALPPYAHKKNSIVITLTEEEKCKIQSKYTDCKSAIELRDHAMLLLGMKMGLRECDIVALNLTDIDWERQIIRIVQQKTNHEIVLPMPTEVGNAIYRYIKYGRPNNKTYSNKLFLKVKTPFDALSTYACYSSINRSLPDRQIRGSGFHVTRKSFATDHLKSGASCQMLVDLLGQTDSQSLDHYLLLDEDRMRMCPLSLAEVSLQMKGDRYETI